MNYDENLLLNENIQKLKIIYSSRGPGKSFPVTTPLERGLLIAVVIAVTAVVGLIICLVSIRRANDEYVTNLKMRFKNETNICLSPSCVSEAANLMASMDLNVDPCNDFYTFVCGNWIRNNHLITSLESQFTKLTKNILLRVKDTLEDLEKKEYLPESKRKTADFYEACMDTDHRNYVGAGEFLSDLKKFGGWPLIDEEWNASDFDWAHLMVQLFENGYINNMLFTIKVDMDVKNTSRSLLSISQPSLGLIRRAYYALPYETLIISYKEIILKLASLLKGDINESSMDEIDEAFELESKIAYIMKEIDMKFPETYYYIMTLQELQAFAPVIPWKKIIMKLLPSHTTITNEERIMVTSPSMIKGLNNILEDMNDKKGRKTLANYMFYRVVFNAANYLSREFNILPSELLGDKSISSLPWESCLKATLELFPLPLTASYVDKYTNKRATELLRMMFEDMRNALADGINSSSWLDAETKDYALLKVQNMDAAIAYEDEIMDDDKLDAYYESVNITDDHFGNIKQMIAFRLKQNMEGLHDTRVRLRWTDVENLLTANAYYRPAENSIIIPVGVLQEPVFAAGRPNYINYGSLGMVVGHELTHGFDSIGSLYDAEGSYRMWWSQTSWKKFEDRMTCFEEQYNKYYMPVADSYVNGTLTLPENIADNGGLKTAYYAYKALLTRIGSEQSLPGIPYNERQMFWISFASVWCRKQTDESIHYSMKHSVHTPSKFRVIGSLSNMEEFSEDFNCKLNSTMNPPKRCFLWK